MVNTTILLGILTLISLITTVTLGILMRRGKQVFKYHRFFAYLTLILAINHAFLVTYRYYF